MPTFFTVYVQDLSENMDSFWVAFDIDENDRVRFRPRYEGLLCPRCQSYDPYAILERGLDPDIKVTHKRGAFSTNDNFLVVDRQARSTLESLARAELVFHELPGDPLRRRPSAPAVPNSAGWHGDGVQVSLSQLSAPALRSLAPGQAQRCPRDGRSVP